MIRNEGDVSDSLAVEYQIWTHSKTCVLVSLKHLQKGKEKKRITEGVRWCCYKLRSMDSFLQYKNSFSFIRLYLCSFFRSLLNYRFLHYVNYAMPQFSRMKLLLLAETRVRLLVVSVWTFIGQLWSARVFALVL